jgi:hypothetical protein
MPSVGSYSLEDRRNEKQASRERDDANLRLGLVSRADLIRENGIFSGLNLAGAAIRRRR